MSLMSLFGLIGSTDPRLENLKERLLMVDRRAKNFPIIWGESNHAMNKKNITLSRGEEHDDDTLTYIAIYLLAHCLNPGYGHNLSYKKLVKELVKRARYARVLNLDNVTCNTSLHREKMMSS